MRFARTLGRKITSTSASMREQDNGYLLLYSDIYFSRVTDN